jgi:hypothetical protein
LSYVGRLVEAWLPGARRRAHAIRQLDTDDTTREHIAIRRRLFKQLLAWRMSMTVVGPVLCFILFA